MDIAFTVFAVCVALFFAMRLTLRHYFPPIPDLAELGARSALRKSPLGKCGSPALTGLAPTTSARIPLLSMPAHWTTTFVCPTGSRNSRVGFAATGVPMSGRFPSIQEWGLADPE